MHTKVCRPAKDLHVRSIGSTGAQTIHAGDIVTVEQTHVKRIDLFDGRRAEDLSKYGFAGNDHMSALRLMFLDVSSQPEFRGFLSPTSIGILWHSQVREIVNCEIRQLASQRREAGRFSNSVCTCDEEEHVLFLEELDRMGSMVRDSDVPFLRDFG
jgi:hypothetical protein